MIPNLEAATQRYFAYGSNMWAEQMRERCPHAIPVGPARLDGYRFLINADGYATIVKDSKAFVYGVEWLLSVSDETSLDGYEGVVRGFYTKTELSIQDPQGNTRTAMVYIAANSTAGPPAKGYLVKILTGARAFQLPASYQNFLQHFQSES